jgi:hypothetical protein
MMKHTIKVSSFRGVGVGVSLAWLALACSSGADNGEPAQPAPAPADSPPAQVPQSCVENPALAGCRDTTPVRGPIDAPAQPPTAVAPVSVPPGAPPVEPTPAACPGQLSTFDELYAAVALDLARLDAADALSARYISLANRVTAGVCVDGALDREREALFKLVNMLSSATTIDEPVAIDSDRTLFRIDLADYGWDEAVTVVNADGSATSFIDKWEAILANNPYAISYVGDEADEAVLDSNTTVPVMLADTLLDVASTGNLYYALVGVNVQDTLDNFILNELQIDVAQNLIDEEQVRAGTANSRASQQERMIQRDEIEVRQGFLWQSFDFEDDSNDSLFQDPFGFAEDGTEAIFTLPNGLFGYIIADANGVILEDSPILFDANQDNFRAATATSCSACHVAGLIPMLDEVRDFALANAVAIGLNNTERDQLEATFPDAKELDRIIATDSASYQRALAAARVPLGLVDPVSSGFFRFEADMTLTDAAGDLGLTSKELERNLNLLDPALQVLTTGNLDREDFTQFYLNSLCVLSEVSNNQPDPFVCAEALLAQ